MTTRLRVTNLITNYLILYSSSVFLGHNINPRTFLSYQTKHTLVVFSSRLNARYRAKVTMPLSLKINLSDIRLCYGSSEISTLREIKEYKYHF